MSDAKRIPLFEDERQAGDAVKNMVKGAVRASHHSAKHYQDAVKDVDVAIEDLRKEIKRATDALQRATALVATLMEDAANARTLASEQLAGTVSYNVKLVEAMTGDGIDPAEAIRND